MTLEQLGCLRPLPISGGKEAKEKHGCPGSTSVFSLSEVETIQAVGAVALGLRRGIHGCPGSDISGGISDAFSADTWSGSIELWLLSHILTLRSHMSDL